MALFVIADLHLSFGTDKPMDIFSGWTDYVSRLEKNWQEIISPDDTVVIPGDVSWAISLDGALKDFKFIDSLPGHKIILKGNHDYWWSTLTKIYSFFKDNNITTIDIINNNFYEYGRVGICGTRGWINDGSEPGDMKVILREAQRLERSVKAALECGLNPVVFLHYPPLFKQERNAPIMDVLLKYGVKLVFYGHLHGYSHRFAVTGEHEGIEFRLVSSDFLHFCPLNISEIVKNHEK